MAYRIIKTPEAMMSFKEALEGGGIISARLLPEILLADTNRGTMKWKPRTPGMFIDRGRRSAEWLCNAWNAKCAGKPAGIIKSGNGYFVARIFGRNYFAHRVIWALHYGEWPGAEIDHIDHDRTNNRISNLRDVSRRANGMNITLPSSNTSGVIGVIWDKSRKKWAARIKVRGSMINLGRFDALEEAVAVRRAAEQEHSFHGNHGAPQ